MYPVMEDAAILAVPVQDFAAQDCQLWLWTTNSHIHLALHCLEAWGFTYKTMATWVKTQFGLGYWLRGQTEHALLGVRGKPRSRFINTKHGATGKAWSTVINAARSNHSEKPEAFLDMVEAMGEPPYLEMFARRQRLGWDVWVDGAVITGGSQEPQNAAFSPRVDLGVTSGAESPDVRPPDVTGTAP